MCQYTFSCTLYVLKKFFMLKSKLFSLIKNDTQAKKCTRTDKNDSVRYKIYTSICLAFMRDKLGSLMPQTF
jgi:hypothetical protein